MKKLLTISLILMLNSPVFAQEIAKETLSDSEIIALKELAAQKTKLVNIAKTLDLETIPLEL